MRHVLLSLLVVLAATPLATADDSGAYLAPGGITGFCTAAAIGYDTGISCELVCVGTCTVTVTDLALDDMAVFSICDWDAQAQADDPCAQQSVGGVLVPGTFTGSTTWTSTTGVIDVFIVVGTTGWVTTT